MADAPPTPDALPAPGVPPAAEETIPLRRSVVRSLRGVRIIGTGSYVPERVVTNADLVPLGFDQEWILKRTGIEERRYLPEGLVTSDMAVAAARRAIESAGVPASDIDLVILGTFTPDMPVPATACRVQEQLGLCCPAFDVQAACAGFVYALVTASQYVATGCSRLALVIGADSNSRAINPGDKKTYPIFGDGAGAVLVAKGSNEQGLLAYTLGADGSGHHLLCRPMGGSRMPPSAEAMARGDQYLFMNGRPVFKWAVRLIGETIATVLAEAHVPLDAVDYFALHQANRRIIDAAADHLHLPTEKVAVNVHRYGNTSAGSIPLALDEARRSGRIHPGHHIILCGFGAGLAWGTLLWRW